MDGFWLGGLITYRAAVQAELARRVEALKQQHRQAQEATERHAIEQAIEAERTACRRRLTGLERALF